MAKPEKSAAIAGFMMMMKMTGARQEEIEDCGNVC